MSRAKHHLKKSTLRNMLREIRKKKKIRQTDLAKLLNRPQSFVSKYESGEKNLDLFELIEVCHALELSVCHVIKELGLEERNYAG